MVPYFQRESEGEGDPFPNEPPPAPGTNDFSLLKFFEFFGQGHGGSMKKNMIKFHDTFPLAKAAEVV